LRRRQIRRLPLAALRRKRRRRRLTRRPPKGPLQTRPLGKRPQLGLPRSLRSELQPSRIPPERQLRKPPRRQLQKDQPPASCTRARSAHPTAQPESWPQVRPCSAGRRLRAQTGPAGTRPNACLSALGSAVRASTCGCRPGAFRRPLAPGSPGCQRAAAGPGSLPAWGPSSPPRRWAVAVAVPRVAAVAGSVHRGSSRSSGRPNALEPMPSERLP